MRKLQMLSALWRSYADAADSREAKRTYRACADDLDAERTAMKRIGWSKERGFFYSADGPYVMVESREHLPSVPVTSPDEAHRILMVLVNSVSPDGRVSMSTLDVARAWRNRQLNARVSTYDSFAGYPEDAAHYGGPAVGADAPQRDRVDWITYHVELGHALTRREHCDECSCGATRWRALVTTGCDCPPDEYDMEHQQRHNPGCPLHVKETR